MGDLKNCRLCLKNEEGVLNVFGETLSEMHSKQKILKYLYLDIREEDTVSKCICIICLQRIEDFHVYCEEVRQNQLKYLIIPDIINVPNSISIACDKPSVLWEPEIIDDKVETDLVVQNNIKVEPTFEIDVELKNNVQPDVKMEPICEIQKLTSEFSESDQSDNESSASLSFYSTNCEARPYGSTLSETEFPKVMIKDAKLAVRGEELIKLMSRFFKLNCDLCSDSSNSKIFSWLPSFISHYENVHSTKGYVVCCDTKYIKLKTMAFHMAKHLQPEAFKCQECGKMLTNPRMLRYHMQNHLPDDKKPLACPNCPKRFNDSTALNAHKIKHLPKEQRDSHVCEECGKRFLSKGILTKHMNIAHSDSRQKFICHECGKQFSSKGNLSYHLATHEGAQHVQCDLCKKWLKDKFTLRKHMLIHSTVLHNCPKCNYSTVNRRCLSHHLKVQHSNDKPYKCEHCDRSFKLRRMLNNHNVQHTGVKKYSCEFCARVFASSGNCYTHRKRMHPIEVAEMNQRKEEEKRAQRELDLAKK